MGYKSEECDMSALQELDGLIVSQTFNDDGAAEWAALEMHNITGELKQICAKKHGINLGNKWWWSIPADVNDDTKNQKIDLIGNYKNPLVDYAKAVAAAVQFPVNTTFLHAIGVLSSATIKEFVYVGRYGSRKHAGLYTVCAQPPSSGKSPTNDHLVSPIISNIDSQNEKNAPSATVLKIEIELLETEIKSKKTPAGERRHIAETIEKKKEDLKKFLPYTWGVTDTTPEALEECAGNQYGKFSIVSDEAEAVSVVFGINYGKAPPNLGFLLKGFDGGQQLTLRIGRQGYRGEVIGAVAVLAQESTVSAILNTGRSDAGSRGVCERFLILNEPNIIHEKDHRRYSAIPHNINADYKIMISNITAVVSKMEITFSDDSIEYIIIILENMQKHISDGGKYANELMRGVIGKAETQICKMATVLHIARAWGSGGNKSTVIDVYDVSQAADIYLQLIKCFVSEAEGEGIAGELLELRVSRRKLSDIINNQKKPRQIISANDFSDGLRGTSPFSAIKGLRKHVKNTLIPLLEKNGFVIFDSENETIQINPHLRQ